jgi:hypothetical protein
MIKMKYIGHGRDGWVAAERLRKNIEMIKSNVSTGNK